MFVRGPREVVVLNIIEEVSGESIELQERAYMFSLLVAACARRITQKISNGQDAVEWRSRANAPLNEAKEQFLLVATERCRLNGGCHAAMHVEQELAKADPLGHRLGGRAHVLLRGDGPFVVRHPCNQPRLQARHCRDRDVRKARVSTSSTWSRPSSSSRE